MELKILQWNIGGGFIRNAEDDVMTPGIYCHDNFQCVIDFVKQTQPDIIALQESHAKEEGVQAEQLAKALGYTSWVNDPCDDSHIDPAAKLSQSIISRFPITSHRFDSFLNPHWTRQEGENKYHSHEKGMTTCELSVDNSTLVVQTLHAVPFNNFFSVHPGSPEAEPVRASMAVCVRPRDGQSYVLAGDFNIDQGPLSDFFPTLKEKGIEEFELDTPTTPKGRHFDHVLYRDLTPVSISSDQTVLTDHYPVIATFSF